MRNRQENVRLALFLQRECSKHVSGTDENGCLLLSIWGWGRGRGVGDEKETFLSIPCHIVSTYIASKSFIHFKITSVRMNIKQILKQYKMKQRKPTMYQIGNITVQKKKNSLKNSELRVPAMYPQWVIKRTVKTP